MSDADPHETSHCDDPLHGASAGDVEILESRTKLSRANGACEKSSGRQSAPLGRGARALLSTLKLEILSGRLLVKPHVAAAKTYARVRRAMLAPNQPTVEKETYPSSLLEHRLMPLVFLAASRPASLRAIEDRLVESFWSVEIEDELSFVLSELSRYPALHREAKNLFVASLRSLGQDNPHAALQLADVHIAKLPDPRALRTLVVFSERAGNPLRALSLVTLLDPDAWATAKRAALEKQMAAQRVDTGPEAFLYRYWGYKNLERDPRPAVLLYGDINLNVIDGSSVWLASVAEALSGVGFQIHFLLKANVERELLLEPLMGRKGVEIIQPRFAGYDHLTPQRAIRVIEAMDGIVGGYAAIIVRGMGIANLAASRRSLWKRVWAYLTDFYGIDEGDDGGLVLGSAANAAFDDFRHVFERFLVQTPQISKVMQDEFAISKDMVVNLPPMIPDFVESGKGTDKVRGVWRLAYAGKIAPQWGVLELLESAGKLSDLGHKIEVHLIGDKIHGNAEQTPTFEEDIKGAIEDAPYVTWHQGLSRSQTLELMRDMDLAWCYRDPALERHTLELSTKLLECLAIQVPMVLTRNAINERLLGADYGLFVDGPGELFTLLKTVMSGATLPSLALERYSDVVRAHRISSVRDNDLGPALHALPRIEQPRRVVLAGHDLKFIGEFESYLKKLGHMVRRDKWEWGEPQDLMRTQQLAEWCDTVFCEWSLANAVWYSNNLAPSKRLVVRLHSQEVHKRGKVFPPRVAIENVDQVVFVSDHIRREAVARFGWDDEPLLTVPNFVHCDSFERDKLPEAAFTIGFVGCVPEMKRLDRALDFIAKLRQRDPRFTLVIKGKLPKDYGWMASRGDEMQYFARQLRRIEQEPLLQEGVLFSEFSPRIAGWYREIGCVLSTSDFESFHYSVAEGAASGALPIIWPWEGAEDLFPSEWIAADTTSAVDRALALLGDNWRDDRMLATRQAIRERYDAPLVFEKLAAAVLGNH